MLVFVYFNLHKKIWSVKALEGPMKRKVVAYSDKVVLRDAKAKVSENGRLRVLKTKQKSVHAGIIGELVSLSSTRKFGRKITYNPYKFKSFVYAEDTDRVFSDSKKVYMDSSRGVFALQ